MAKRFITIEEAADILGKSVADVEELIASGQLDQFKDGDQTFCKTDEVEAMAAGGDDIALADPATDVAGTGFGDGGDEISLADPATDVGGFGTGVAAGAADQTFYMTPDDHSGAFDLSADGGVTGESVFDENEVSSADSKAQTRVEDAMVEDDDEDELVLEAVGSGSGLLDLTRESDDTSLGAELLEEIYPAGATGSQTGFSTGVGAAAGASGTFGANASATGGVTPSGLAGIFDTGTGTGAQSGFSQPAEAEESMAAQSMMEPGAPAVQVIYAPEPIDYPGSGLALGLLFPAFVGLSIAMLMLVFAMAGLEVPMVKSLIFETGFKNSIVYYCGGVSLAALIFGGGLWAMGLKFSR